MFQDQSGTSRPRSEKRLVACYVILICLAMAHAVYYAYSADYTASLNPSVGFSAAEFAARQFTKPLTVAHPIFMGHDFAPNQYRIGVVSVAKIFAKLIHISKLYGIYALIDFVCGSLACYCIYSLLGRSAFLVRAPQKSQLGLVSLLLAAFIFPIAWVSQWGRPETVPSALFLALAFFMIVRVKSQSGWIALILALTLWQSFVRTDISGVLGLTIFLLSLTAYGTKLFGSRRLGLILGASIACLSAGVQYALKHFIYPHAVYPVDTPQVVFFYNFASVRNSATTLIALIPYFILLVVAAKHWRKLDPEDILALGASVIYLPLWCTFGILSEVRIFVPFLLVLTPAMAKLMYIVANSDSLPPESAFAADRAVPTP